MHLDSDRWSLPRGIDVPLATVQPSLPPLWFAYLPDQVGRDLRFLLRLEPVYGRIPPPNDLDNHEADVDPGPLIASAISLPRPGRSSPRARSVGMDERSRPAVCAAACDFFPETGDSSIAPLVGSPGNR